MNASNRLLKPGGFFIDFVLNLLHESNMYCCNQISSLFVAFIIRNQGFKARS